jgi:hypothetical protein
MGNETNDSGSPKNVKVSGTIETRFTPEFVKDIKTGQAQEHARETNRSRVEIATLIVIFIYTLVALWQGWSTRKAANAAKSAADTAAQTLGENQRQFRLDQRPYLIAAPRGSVEDLKTKTAHVLFQPSGENACYLSVSVDLPNKGKSPAIEVMTTKTEYVVGPVKEATEAARSYVPIYPYHGVAVVAAGTGVTPVSDTKKLSMEDCHHFNDKTWTVFIVGAAEYRDIYSPRIDPYVTTYCFQLEPTGMPFANCDFGPGEFGDSIK